MLRPQIERYLAVNGISYRLLPRALHDGAGEAESLGGAEAPSSDSGVEVATTRGVLVELDSGDEVICLIPREAEVDLDALCDLVEAKDAVVCEAGRYIELFPGCDIGEAPAFAGLWGVPVIVDTDVELSDRIRMPAGDEDQDLEIRTVDYLYMEEPQVGAIASYPGQPWKHAMPAGAFVPKPAEEVQEQPQLPLPPPPASR